MAIGVESGNEEILKTMGKTLTKDQIRRGCQVLKTAKMPFLASYIIGHPGDTHETIRQTLDFANELDADQSKFLIATPYPGTRFFDMAVARGIIPKEGAKDLGDHTYFQHVAANLSKYPMRICWPINSRHLTITTNVSGHWCKNPWERFMIKNSHPPDVVLIYPKTGLDLGSTIAPPFALLTIAAPLLNKGIRVKIIDQRVDKNWSQQLPRRP